MSPSMVSLCVELGLEKYDNALHRVMLKTPRQFQIDFETLRCRYETFSCFRTFCEMSKDVGRRMESDSVIAISDRCTRSRRVRDSLFVHIASLMCGYTSASRELKSLVAEGRKKLSILERSFQLWQAFITMGDTVQDFPFLLLFAFFVKAVLVRSMCPVTFDEDQSSAMYEECFDIMQGVVECTARIIKDACGRQLVHMLQRTMSIFKAWDETFPATAEYDESQRAAIERFWFQEVTEQGLQVPPDDQEGALFEDEKRTRWVDQACAMFTTLPPAIRELARCHFQAKEFCKWSSLGSVGVGSSTDSYVGYVLDEVEMVRCSQLQTVVSHIWHTLAKPADDFLEHLSSAGDESEPKRALEELFWAMCVSSSMIDAKGSIFETAHRYFWYSFEQDGSTDSDRTELPKHVHDVE